MAVIAEGLHKVVSYKKETTQGVPASPAGATSIRRITSAFLLKKDVYASAEIRSDYQDVDFRHGVRRVEGSVSGELSGGSYSDFIGSAIGKAFTAVTPITGASITIASSGSFYTLTRAAGSFITDGITSGMVVRLAGAGFTPSNINKNILVVSLTATVLTVVILNGLLLIPEGPIAAATVSIPGKVAYTPSTGIIDDTYTVEEFYPDISQSEVSVGNKINTMGISLPATGLVTANFTFMGLDQPLTGTSAYFTSPTPIASTGIFASVNGALLVNGQPVALITQLAINVNRNITSDAVVGSNVKPELFEGRVLVDGTFSTLFQDRTFSDMFKNEVEVSIVAAVSNNQNANADFNVFVLPRVKVNSDDKADGEKGVVASNTFKALKGTGANGFQATTIQVQDSLAL